MTKTKTKDTTAAPAAAWGDIGQLLTQFKLPGLDLQAIAESQRKDMETLAQAHQQAYEGLQAVAQRRDEMVAESLAQWRESLPAGSNPGDLLAQTSERAQQGLTQGLAQLRELGEMEAASRLAVWQTVQDRMQANFADLQQLLKPQ